MITLMSKNFFHYLNMSNTWNIPSIHRILEHCSNCDADNYIAPKSPFSHNEENIKWSKEAHEYSRGSIIVRGKGGQHKHDHGKWKRDKEKPSVGDNNINHNSFVNGVRKSRNRCMCYCKRKKCIWNNTHTSGFHAEWQSYTSAFCLPVDHEYWKLSRKTDPNHGTYGWSFGGGGTQVSNMADHHMAAISELVQHHKGDSSESNSASFLYNFYELMYHLKLLGVDWLTWVSIPIQQQLRKLGIIMFAT